MPESKIPASEEQKRERLIVVTDTYFRNMQKRLADLIPDLHITDIGTMKKLTAFYDWLHPDNVREAADEHISHINSGKAVTAAIDFKTKPSTQFCTWSENGEKFLVLMNTQDSSTICFKVESIIGGIQFEKFHPEEMFREKKTITD